MQTMEQTITKPKLYGMTRDLMDHHGLQDWEIRIGSAKRLAGSCNYRKRVIMVSYEIHKAWPMDQIRDTILHEIAHALTPADKGHGKDWKAKCVEIGANPTRCYDGVNLPTPKGDWVQSCACGDSPRLAHRRKADVRWSKCGHDVMYRKVGEPASAAKPFKGSEAKGSKLWAQTRTVEMGGSVRSYGYILQAPKGMVWAMTETHYIDLTLSTYSDYDQTVSEARKMVHEDIDGGFRECGCDYMCKDGE